MLRVSAGHYRDSFCRVCYDVRRCAPPWGGPRPTHWGYTLYLPSGEFTDGTWTTKEQAATAARVTIDAICQKVGAER